MALPKIDYPIHEIFLKSLNRKVKFRPFLVKEEKILLIAKESKEIDDVKNSIKQIIQNCCLEDIDIDALPLFDIEMFFVHLRAKSIGDSAKLMFTCKNTVEDQECGTETEYTIDLSRVEYIVPEGHTNIIKLTDKVGIVLKYPTITIAAEEFDDMYESTVSVFKNNVDYIYDEDSIYKRKDIEDDELEEFLENLTMQQIEAIRKFFITTPRVAIKDRIICSKCKYDHELVVENIYSFFT